MFGQTSIKESKSVRPLGRQVLCHEGGVFLEAVSVCHVDLSGPSYSLHCLDEAAYAMEQLSKSSKTYVVVAACALEQEDAPDVLRKLSELPRVRGVRQILNHEPNWPRNGRLGDLLENVDWQKGFSLLETYNLSFDMQLNPHQFKKAAELLTAHPKIPVIIDHLGSPRLEDLQKADEYWEGLTMLAALPQTFMKISMLSYTHKAPELSLLSSTFRFFLET